MELGAGGYGAEPLAEQERPVALAALLLVPNEDVAPVNLPVWIGEVPRPDLQMPEKAARRPARSLIIFRAPFVYQRFGARAVAAEAQDPAVVEEVVRQREFYVNRGRVALLQRRARSASGGTESDSPAKACVSVSTHRS